MVGADLYFIKTKNTGSGRVEVHTATAASGFRSGVHQATVFSPGDASNGWFQIDGGDLVFIKTKKTGSGRVEYFRASAASGFQQVVTATRTAFSPADADNGWFQSQAGDLVFLKTKNTGSGRVEYFRATRSSNYRQVTIATGTAFSPTDADNGWFSSEDVNGDGRADLVFVKTKNVQSGRVELFVADGARNFQQLTSMNVTWFGRGDSDNGWFQVGGKQ